MADSYCLGEGKSESPLCGCVLDRGSTGQKMVARKRLGERHLLKEGIVVAAPARAAMTKSLLLIWSALYYPCHIWTRVNNQAAISLLSPLIKDDSDLP